MIINPERKWPLWAATLAVLLMEGVVFLALYLLLRFA